MTLPASGAISLNQVNVELGLAGTTSINMNQTTVRNLFGKPTSASAISMSDGYGKSFLRKSFLTMGGGAPAYAHTYEWTSTGYGSRYANPTTLPTSATGGFGGDFNSPDNDAIVQVFSITSSASGVQGYKWSDSGYGTKYTNPAITVGWETVQFNPADKTRFIISAAAINFVRMFEFNSTTGFGTTYASSTFSGISLFSARYNSSGNTVFGAGTASPYVHAWPATTSGFGTKYANPPTALGGSGAGVEPNPSNTVVLVGGGIASGPRIHAYAWTTASGFGTKYANPATFATGGTGQLIAWSPSGTVAFSNIGANPGIQAYNFSVASGFGTVLTAPSASGLVSQNAARFNREGNAIVTTTASTPFTHAWAWTGSAFGSKFANPASLPNSNTRRSPGLSTY